MNDKSGAQRLKELGLALVPGAMPILLLAVTTPRQAQPLPSASTRVERRTVVRQSFIQWQRLLARR